jgi:pimeloyl-CoA dehydrogenase small subunit
MDFDFSEDQRLLKDSVDRLIADTYGFEQRHQFIASADGWSRENWARFAELGLLGVNFSEDHGGFGGGLVETMLVAEAFGRALVVEPYFASVILSGALLRHAAPVPVQDAYLPNIATGELLFAFAHHERRARHVAHHVETTAQLGAAGWVLHGEKSLVLHGDCADKLLVSARISSGARELSGIGLFLVDAAHVGRRGYPTQDGQRAAEISLDGVVAEAVLSLDAWPAISRALDEATAFQCAEAMGAMEELLALTVDYLKTRKQFGRAIGDFQVLQHRAVDMKVQLELARSMAMYATMMAAEDDADNRARAISAAKVQVGRSLRHVGQEAIQLHGGIGVTMEYKAGHYFKRLTMIEKSLGDTDTHLERLAAMGTAF